MSRLLVFVGHPGRKSFTGALAEAYAEGARSASASVRVVHLGELKFNLSLGEGYHQAQTLEPDLVQAQQWIREAGHLVFCYPQWWGSAPALLKGFIDRTFLPGFAFKYHATGPFWDKLLSGRSGEIWMLSDSPSLWTLFKYWNSPIKWLKSATLEFCGVRPVKVQVISRVRFLSAEQRQAWLERARRSGVEAGKKFLA